MADAFSYPLLVELGENNVPRLKNKLIKYFQSRKSNGGDCEIDYENGSRTAVLHFRKEEDQQSVLRKEAHQITVDKEVLKMTVRLPPREETAQEGPPVTPIKNSHVAVENKQLTERTPAAEVQTEAKSGGDDAADEEPCSTSAVLGNIPETLSQEFLEMLVENVLKDRDSSSASKRFTLEVIPDASSAVVTFHSAKDNTDFVTRCPQNRMFTNKKLSVQPLEVTAQVAVEDMQELNQDLLELYFANEGGDVEDVMLNEVEQSAVITFKDHKAVQNVMKKKHHIKQKDIRVYPFYKSLGTALYGKDRPSLKLPAPFSKDIDSAVWRYLNENQRVAETIHSDLAKHFCNVNLKQLTVSLKPVPSLLQQKDAKAMIKVWRDTVESAFAQAMSKFKSLKFQPESEVWEESEENIRQMLRDEDVVVVPDKAGGVLSVVGRVDDVNRLEEPLCDAINRIVKRVHREKSSVTQVINVSQSIFHILCQDGLQDKLLSVYPDLKMSTKNDSPGLTITGLNHEIMAASTVIYEAILKLKHQNLEMDIFVLSLLKEEEQEELTNALFTSNGINAAFKISANGVQLRAVSDKDLNVAEDHLGSLLMSQYITIEDSNVLKMPEWKDLVSQLENTNSKPCRRLRVEITGQQVVVSGHKASVVKVTSELDDFLMQNAQVEETVAVKPNIIVEYVKRHKTSHMKQKKDKVVVSYLNEAISLSGPRGAVMDHKTVVENVVRAVCFESFKVSKPGVRKFFQDKEKIYFSALLNETGCLVRLVDGRQVLTLDSGPRQSVCQLQTPDGVEITVCKADMCSYPVHAVVNASNCDLKHNGGLAAALLKAAGPQLQDDCDKIIHSKGKFKPGDCTITDARGQLCCKKVIHTVGPKFDSTKTQKVNAQLKKAVKGSLELAERHGCTSVALPTISRSQGFPVDLCAIVITKAVKEYCDERQDDSILKKIHLVDCEDAAVKAMEAAVRQEFGISHSSQPLPTNTNNSPLVKAARPAGSDPNCLGQVRTKEGLDIILTKGQIEKATTEVTVNTVFEDLALNRGAVSNAILHAAGPKLQQLINAKSPQGATGEVIVTDGCNLKSKQVFHAVAPSWDKGQGTAEKILSAIFKDCLEKAESASLTSISFPAIGTGNLGFPKDLVASVILNEISAFSSTKQPQHLKKVVIVLFPGDAPTIQAFSDKFQKSFPNASSAPVSTSAPQRPCPFSKVVSSSGLHEVKMGGVAIQVFTGDIIKETTDVIVNSSNDNFSLKTGVSMAILNAAGQTVEQECQSLAAQPHSGMIMTQPGNLKCKKILHVVGQTDPVKIQNVVRDALQMCVKNSHTSVSFPAIGTGQGNVQAKQVADAMLDAVIDVLSQNAHGPLKTIRIVIFQAPMLNDFSNSMHEREVPDPKDKTSFWGNIGTKLKSLFTGDSSSKPHQKDDFVLEAIKAKPVFFHICGDTQAQVGSAKKWIDSLITKEQTSITIQDNFILDFSHADFQRVLDIQKTTGVSITTESKQGQASFTIEGLSVDVLTACREIHDLLKNVKDEEELKSDVEQAGKKADWQYQQQGLQFQSFDAMTNFQLEQAWEKQLKQVKVTVQGQDYTANIPNGPATDSQGRTLQIKRIDKLKDEDIPGHWDTMPANTSCQAIPIKVGTTEYTEVQNLFQASCNRTIIKIERIQNPVLWKSLQIKKRDMDQRNGHKNNERRLFHGTCHTTVSYINQHGFNRSYAGKNAAAYGNGTYFAVNANYSASDTYSKPNQNGEKCMYLCRVLTGDFTGGQSGMIVPPPKGAVSIQLYDSVVDRMPTPSMFIIFHDSQACPEYLITFK